MAEPTADDVDFDARLQQMNRCSMTKDVRGDAATVCRRSWGFQRLGSTAYDLIDAETSQGWPDRDVKTGDETSLAFRLSISIRSCWAVSSHSGQFLHLSPLPWR